MVKDTQLSPWEERIDKVRTLRTPNFVLSQEKSNISNEGITEEYNEMPNRKEQEQPSDTSGTVDEWDLYAQTEMDEEMLEIWNSKLGVD